MQIVREFFGDFIKCNEKYFLLRVMLSNDRMDIETYSVKSSCRNHRVENCILLKLFVSMFAPRMCGRKIAFHRNTSEACALFICNHQGRRDLKTYQIRNENETGDFQLDKYKNTLLAKRNFSHDRRKSILLVTRQYLIV